VWGYCDARFVLSRLSVSGLWAWCQGCGHGGHLAHMLEWFKGHALCPTGCRCVCVWWLCVCVVVVCVCVVVVCVCVGVVCVVVVCVCSGCVCVWW